MVKIFGTAVSRFTVPKFSSLSAEKCHREQFCAVFHKNSGSEKNLWKREDGYQDFPSKFLCITLRKFFVAQPFRVALISGIESVGDECWHGSIKIFPQLFFVSQCRKVSKGNPFVQCFRKFS